MIKLCYISVARSDYGPIKWLLKEIKNDDLIQLQLIVTGGHLSDQQGSTVSEIEADGFHIDYLIPAGNPQTKEEIARSMGRIGEGVAEAFSKLQPDYVMVLGDRYELLPICSTACVMRIPIVHISGGDVTKGAIDDGIRNAVTMLAEYHFPSTVEAAQRIKRMRDDDRNIWVVGEPGLDAFYRMELLDRSNLAQQLGLNCEKKWVLLTYHPETTRGTSYNLKAISGILNELLKKDDLQIIASYANADLGGCEINQYLEKMKNEHPDRIKVISSLGQKCYLSMMRQAAFVIGNSSSGIIETPLAKIPAINVGSRQLGRHLCSNIIQTEVSDIRDAIDKALNDPLDESDLAFWGSGNTVELMMRILKETLSEREEKESC